MNAGMTGRPLTGAPRLTVRTLAAILGGALALFAAAYGVGTLFGHAADGKAPATAGPVISAAVPGENPPDASLLAKNVAYDQAEISVPAGRPVLLRVENEDAGIFHNIAVYRASDAADLVARGALFNGPRTREYRFDGFAAGAYYFQCDLHPQMHGTLIAR